MSAGRERRSARHRDPLELRVDHEGRLGAVDTSRVDRQLGRVQHQPIHRRIALADTDIDQHRPGERGRLEIRFETDLVAGRQGVAGQAMGVDHPRDTTPGLRCVGLASNGCETRTGERARADPT